MTRLACTGSNLPATAPTSKDVASGDSSFVPYSVNLAQTHYSELSEHTLAAGKTTCSYKDWEAQRCAPASAQFYLI